MLSFALIASGSLLTYLAFKAEHNSYDIWTRYKKNYKQRSSKFLDRLYRPNYMVYRFHVYVLWPVIAAVGVSAVVLGVLRVFL